MMIMKSAVRYPAVIIIAVNLFRQAPNAQLVYSVGTPLGILICIEITNIRWSSVANCRHRDLIRRQVGKI